MRRAGLVLLILLALAAALAVFTWVALERQSSDDAPSLATVEAAGATSDKEGRERRRVASETVAFFVFLTCNGRGRRMAAADSIASVAELLGCMVTDTDLLEYADSWGNPLVYIHSRDYDDAQTYVLKDGSEVTVEARRDPGTGAFSRPESFQLFSIGPDQIPGTDDDLHWGDF